MKTAQIESPVHVNRLATSHGAHVDHIQETPEQHMARLEREISETRQTAIKEEIARLPRLFDVATIAEVAAILVGQKLNPTVETVQPRVKRAYVRRAKIGKTGKRAHISDLKRARIIKAGFAGRRSVTDIAIKEKVSRQSIYAILDKARKMIASMKEQEAAVAQPAASVAV